VGSGVAPSPSTPQAARPEAIDAVAVSRGTSGNTIVKFTLKAPPANPPAGFAIASPARIALDFNDTANGLGTTQRVIDDASLRSLNVIQAGGRTRVVFNLNRPQTFSTQVEGNTVLVTLFDQSEKLDAKVQTVQRFAESRPGDVQHVLRDVDFRTTQAQAQATLGQARARLGLEGGRAFNPEETAEVRAAAAQRDIADDARRRAEQLYGSGSISDAELQRARASADAATAQYRSALNGMRGAYFAYQQAAAVAQQASRALSDSVVRAPFGGEVAERRINVGEYVTPQRAIALVVKTDVLRMEIQVPQERISQVQRDQRVEVRVDAFPDRVFAGTIRYISAAVRADTRSLIAEAVIPNEDGALRPGLFATARIAVGTRRAAVAVPLRAVLSEAGTSRVFVVADGRAQERVVTVAQRDGDTALIERGVAAGERVATDNLTRLGDGVRVAEQ
jgi:RND family efflux transporter MFP subunit